MTDNELLLAISNIVSKQIAPLSDKITRIELSLENNILPRLQNIESCYTSTFNRYQSGVAQIDTIQSDVDILKTVVASHSEKLQQFS